MYGGLVQIKQGGVWGSICDTDWTLSDANVVCRQLGLANATATNASLDEGVDATAFPVSVRRNFACTGEESTLTMCGGSTDELCADDATGVAVTCAPTGVFHSRIMNDERMGFGVDFNEKKNPKTMLIS